MCKEFNFCGLWKCLKSKFYLLIKFNVFKYIKIKIDNVMIIKFNGLVF